MVIQETHVNAGRAIRVVLCSCAQPFSTSLIRKLSLWFQHNSTKESYDANRMMCTGLYFQRMTKFDKPKSE